MGILGHGPITNPGKNPWSVYVSFTALALLLTCSCSSIGTGQYLVAQPKEGDVPLPKDVWRTYGLPPPGFGLPRHMTAESGVGDKRPIVMQRSFDNDLCYVLYPVVLHEEVLFFGPILPVIPVLLFDQSDSTKEEATYRVYITWIGDMDKADHISVRRGLSGMWSEGRRIVFERTHDRMECAYVFDEPFAEECELKLHDAHSDRLEVIPLLHLRGVEWSQVRFLNAPRYPDTYPGQRTKRQP